jgi:molecular chaperone DnaK
MQFQIDSLDTGWSSGRLELKNSAALDVLLSKNGDNTFKLFVFDSSGGPIAIDHDIIVITRTATMVDAIPASSSIALETRVSMSDPATRRTCLVRKGESLPMKGTLPLQAAEALRAGGPGALVFNLFEGEIENPVRDNEPVGSLKITGEDFDTGVISPGDKLNCEFEVSDSGRVSLSVSVSKVGAMKSGEFYSQTVPLNYLDPDTRQFVMDESRVMMDRVDKFAEKLAQDHPKLDAARNKLLDADDLAQREDPEDCKQGMENVFAAKRMLAQVRKENLKTVRQTELEAVTNFFQTQLRQYARPSEVTAFQSLARKAQRDKDNINSGKFEDDLDKLKGMNFGILWRQDSFVIDIFQGFSKEEFRFTDKAMFHQLVRLGNEAVKSDDMENLRKVVASLYQIRIYYDTDQCFLDAPNIIRLL